MKKQNITKDKFEAFRTIRNMPMVDASKFNDIIILARKHLKVELTKDECFEMYRNYMEYVKLLK